MTQRPLGPLLCPRSIAFVGASDRPDSTGAAMLAMPVPMDAKMPVASYQTVVAAMGADFSTPRKAAS